MTDLTAPKLLRGCGLPLAWANQPAWRILDTRFGSGLDFLNTWLAWQNDPARPRLLHYVALTQAPISLAALLASASHYPELTGLAQELSEQWIELQPGFHRLSLNGHQVLLTLCIGELTSLLREQSFVADSVYLNLDHSSASHASDWNVWTAKALARCCRRGTTFASSSATPACAADLKQCGFEFKNRLIEDKTDSISGQFNPRWTIKNTREPAPGQTALVGRCVVIGAGLAGASVAAALARRGWQVRVLDQGDAPAAGASGLPVGLVVPHVSADDCPLSRLSRRGVRLMLQQARTLLQKGQDWDATGTREHRFEGTESRPALWHAQAAWLKPAQLVRAWLAQPGVTFQGNAHVAEVRQIGQQWALMDAQGTELARADRVIFANASGAKPLVERLQLEHPELGIDIGQLSGAQGVLGQLSWALHQSETDGLFPPTPVNGAGSVIPRIPVEGGKAWFIGSSYQPEGRTPRTDEKNHAANLGRVHKLIHELGQALASQFEVGPIQSWKSTRFVTPDRLPLVGPLTATGEPTLWLCAGMGSRGMTFSVLCAELLAARWSAEPWPVEAGLAKSLDAMRG